MRYQCATPRPDFSGDIDALSLWAGQGVGLVSRVEPAAEIVHEIAKEADAALRRLGAQLGLGSTWEVSAPGYQARLTTDRGHRRKVNPLIVRALIRNLLLQRSTVADRFSIQN